MMKAKALIRWSGIFVAVFTVAFVMRSPAVFGVKTEPRDAPENRADIIFIDSINVFGKLERPPVPFLHQKHTEALAKKNKDCSVCHLSEKERMSIKYKRLADTQRQEVMDLYHTNCIGCHKETAAANEKSGPVECGGCHREPTDVVSSWQPIGMDKSLHFRHSKAMDKKCEKCHHEYNENTKKLFYAKGKEVTCRYCHREMKEENRISMRAASHTACIDCHRKVIAKNDSAGPFTCNGCHSPGQQALIERVKDVPRMERGQPDYLIVKTSGTDVKEANPLTRMNHVPFNHRAHEQYNDTCRVCHHKALDDCARCHSLEGSKDGDNVTLQQAMHRLKVNQSCVGCHENKLSDKNCAGCHTSFERKRQQGTTSCANCHMLPKSQITSEMQAEEKKMIAAMTLERRQAVTNTYDSGEIPETVVIKTMADKYEPVRLPHRKIVNTLFNKIKDNKLTNYFHHEKGTICQGCHHNSPAAAKPPSCASCHGKPFNEKDPFKPGLKGAYHRQCMECHKAMDIVIPVSTNCTACHPKKS
jgi:hypothetical protein